MVWKVMVTSILTTKFYIPPPARVGVALAGFGKTTLMFEWITGCGRLVAWVSLDKGDNDPSRFRCYAIAAWCPCPSSDRPHTPTCAGGRDGVELSTSRAAKTKGVCCLRSPLR